MSERVPRVLIVDDVKEILEFFTSVADLMRVAPFEMVTESDARIALEKIERESFDVVISDFRMPHHNGVEVLTRSKERNPEGRRVLMTGYNELPVTPADLRGANVDAYLQKPLGAQEILLLLWGLIAAEPVTLEEYRKEARALELTVVAGGA